MYVYMVNHTYRLKVKHHLSMSTWSITHTGWRSNLTYVCLHGQSHLQAEGQTWKVCHHDQSHLQAEVQTAPKYVHMVNHTFRLKVKLDLRMPTWPITPTGWRSNLTSTSTWSILPTGWRSNLTYVCLHGQLHLQAEGQTWQVCLHGQSYLQVEGRAWPTYAYMANHTYRLKVKLDK